MRIEVTYKGGHRTELETTDLKALGQSVIAVEYDLPLDDIESDGLWLMMRSHEAKPDDSISNEELPVANRRNEWCLWLAAPEMVESIDQIAVNGQIVAQRFGDELIQTSNVNAMARVWLENAGNISTVDKIALVYKCLSRLDSSPTSDGDVYLAELLGISADALERARRANAPLHEEHEAEEMMGSDVF